MKKVAAFYSLFLLLMVTAVHSDDLSKIGAYLKLMDSTATFRRHGCDQNFVAFRGSTFKIVHVENDTCYLEFEKIIKRPPGEKDRLQIKANKDTSQVKTEQDTSEIQIDKYKYAKVTKENRYCIAQSQITEAYYQLCRKWYAAAFTVPIKYRPGGGKNRPSALATDFDISSALGFSFRPWNWDITYTPIIFAGLAAIALNDVNTNDMDTRFGIMYGAGFAFTFAKNYQIAIFVGRDILTGSIADQWPYQNKAWFAVGLGCRFITL